MRPPPALPVAKRARIEEPASQSFSQKSNDAAVISLQIHCADDQVGSSYNLRGQIVAVPSVDVKATIKVLKGQIGSIIGMPANKMNLRLPETGPKEFIRDTTIVENAGIADGAVLLLTARTRGGR